MGLRKETVKLSLITGISIVGGLLFHILLGRRFGVSWQLDCFFIVLAILGCLAICNTFITALFIPIFNEVKAKGSKQESIVFAEVTLKWLLCITIVVIILVMSFKKQIIQIIAPGFSSKNILLSTQIINIIIYSLFFTSIIHVVTLTLNALYYYTVPALTGLLNPILNIIVLFAIVPFFGIEGLAFGYLVANAVRACILLIYFYKKVNSKPSLTFYHKKLPELIVKSSKMALNGLIWGSRDIIIRSFASRMGEGAVTLFTYGEKIINILIQVIISPLVRVFYSRISEWIPLCKWEDIRALFKRAARASFFIGMLISAGAISFLPSALHLIFYKSKFTANDINILIKIFNVLLVYFVILLIEQYLTRIIYALKKISVVTINALTGVLLMVFIIAIFQKQIGIYALPLSIVFSQSIVCLMYFYFVRKFLKVGFFALLHDFQLPFFISLIFALMGAGLNMFINNHLIMISLILPLWLGAYFLLAKKLLKKEMEILFSK